MTRKLRIEGFNTEEELQGFIGWLETKMSLNQVEFPTPEGTRVLKHSDTYGNFPCKIQMTITSRGINERDGPR